MARRFTLALAAALILGAAPAARLCAQQTYTLTDITAPPAGTPVGYPAGPVGINASGQIAGLSASGPFRWIPASPNSTSGTLSLLPMPAGAVGAGAFALNDLGQVVGFAQYLGPIVKVKKYYIQTYVDYPELWQPNGTPVGLTTSGGKAFAINDAGEVVGAANGGPFLWVNGTSYLLPVPYGGTAVAINKSGQIVGLWLSGGYLWTPSTPNGTSGTYIQLPFYPNPNGINDLGQVVGFYSSDELLYTGSGVVDLGAPAYGSSQDSAGINNKTQVAWSHYLWDSTNGLRDLNNASQFTLVNGSGWIVHSANGINDYGQIVGWGTNAAGQQRIFLLTPQ